ncbi:hypothetical protein C8F04DRAFT_1110732 [Mycena alexandri]|uniref:RING-type domain-containing protein n=1 Tax=Mycena alexandri TaxID=1745969 RepID=A0AAD6SRT6_9AGAR|nr:hypothetical protein C8F04DRAFT_1110732 [Mycena alexandri]
MSGLPPPGFRWVIKAPQYPKPKGSNHKRHRKPCLVAVGSGSEETPIYVGPGTRDEPWEFDLEDDEAPNGAISPGPSTSPTNQALTFPSTSTSKKMLTPKDLYMNGLLPPIRPPQSNPILQCAVCKNTYSHPVSLAQCRHTFCYACIRCAMQYDLHCPICRDRISEPPVRVSAGVNLKGKKMS